MVRGMGCVLSHLTDARSALNNHILSADQSVSDNCTPDDQGLDDDEEIPDQDSDASSDYADSSECSERATIFPKAPPVPSVIHDG